MIEDIKTRIETVTSQNGYAIFPRQVVVLEEANDIHEQPLRTVGLSIDTCTDEVSVLINAEGSTECALRSSIFDVLWLDYFVTAGESGEAIRVSKYNQAECVQEFKFDDCDVHVQPGELTGTEPEQDPETE